jgi:hypothetical protein
MTLASLKIVDPTGNPDVAHCLRLEATYSFQRVRTYEADDRATW